MGPNGAGKSTLLKLMTGQLDPLDGMVKRHNHLRIGQYHQHLTELLPEDLTPLEYMLREFGQDQGEEKMRAVIGRFGITGPQQVRRAGTPASACLRGCRHCGCVRAIPLLTVSLACAPRLHPPPTCRR